MPAITDRITIKTKFGIGRIFLSLSLTQRVMTIIFFGIATVGIAIALLLENEHHKSVLQQNKMQAVTYLYGVERSLLEIDMQDKGAIAETLANALKHRNGEQEFSLFSLSLLDAKGEVIARTLKESRIHPMKMGETFSPDLENMAGHHVKQLQDEGANFVGSDVRYIHDLKTGEKTATMTVSIPI